MSVMYHTNGTATLYVGQGTGGSAIGLSSADGVQLTLTQVNEEIYSDERGPSSPSEVLMNGSTALIECELWKFDTTVVNNLLALREGGSQGKLNQVGQLMFSNSMTFGLTIASPIDGQTWYFPRCWIPDDVGPRLSTQLKYWNFKVRAVPAGNSNPANATLYTFL